MKKVGVPEISSKLLRALESRNEPIIQHQRQKDRENCGDYCPRVHNKAQHPGSGTPGQWCPTVNWDAIPALSAAGFVRRSLVLVHILGNAAQIPHASSTAKWSKACFR